MHFTCLAVSLKADFQYHDWMSSLDLVIKFIIIGLMTKETHIFVGKCLFYSNMWKTSVPIKINISFRSCKTKCHAMPYCPEKYRVD